MTLTHTRLFILAAATLPLSFAILAVAPAEAQVVDQIRTRSTSGSSSRSKAQAVNDARYRKRYIVAPTGHEIPRRIDFQSLSTRDTLMLPTYLPQYPKNDATGFDANGNAIKTSTLPGREGVTPPPPPVHSSLLPSSLAKEAASESAVAKSLPGATSHTASGHTNSVPVSPPSQTEVHVPLSSNRIVEIKTEAQILAKKGKLPEAQALLDSYAKTYPKEPAIKAELAKVSLARSKSHSKQGDHAQAAKHARLAVSHAMSAAPELTPAASQALDASIQKLGINPKDAAARSTLGDKLTAQNRHIEAEIEYRAAAKLKPTTQAHLKVGNAALQSGRHTEAKAAYQDALELNPDSSQALRQLGITRYHLHDYAGASADLTRALVLDQSDTQAASALIGLWKEQVKSRPSDANSHLGLARAYQVAGDLTQAQSEYKTVVQLNPNHPHLPAARQSFKLAYARQEAKKSFDQAHVLESSNLTAAYQKATDAVGLLPADKTYKAYWESLSEKIRAQGLTVPTTASAQSLSSAAGSIDPVIASQMAAMGHPIATPANISEEQPPAASLPTAQAIGLAQSPAAAQAAAQAPAQQFGAENGFRPMSTDTQVATIADFLGSMRQFTLQQQAEIDKNTSTIRQALKSSTASILGTGSSSSTAPAVTGSSAASAAGSIADAPAAATADDALANAAAALSNTAGASATASAPASSSGSSTDSPMTLTGMALGARQAMSASGESGSRSSAFASLASTAAPTLMSGKFKTISKADVGNVIQSTANRYGFGTPAATTTATTAAPPTAASTTATTPTTTVYPATQFEQFNKINSLQSQNQQLQAQLSQAQQTIQSMQYAQPQTPMQQVAPMQQSQDFSPVAPLQQIAPLQQAAPLTAINHSPEMPALKPQMALPPAPESAARLYLTGVKASKSDVQLKVVLQNAGTAPLKIPGNLNATVRNTGAKDLVAKVNFGSKSIAPGASTTGTIKVPGTSLSPAADIFIPSANMDNANLADLHLTVPISQR